MDLFPFDSTYKNGRISIMPPHPYLTLLLPYLSTLPIGIYLSRGLKKIEIE